MAGTKKKGVKEIKKDKEFEEKVEKIVEKKIEEYFEDKNKTRETLKSAPVKIFGELMGYAIALVILFYIVPRLSFVTEDYPLYLPIAFWATTIGTFFKILRHASIFNALKRIFEIGEHVTTLYSTYWFIVIFPFDFARVGYGQLNFYIRNAMYIVIFALMIAILVNFIRIFIPERKKSI